MIYQIEISPQAQRDMRELSGFVRAQALKIIRSLGENPFPPRSKELRDKPNIYRIWLAKKWRIVYSVSEDPHQVLILRIRIKEHIDYDSA